MGKTTTSREVVPEPGPQLADYYTESLSLDVVLDPAQGAYLPNGGAMPFECPSCGVPMLSLYRQALTGRDNTSKVELWCRKGCFSVWKILVKDLIDTVPRIAEAIKQAKLLLSETEKKRVEADKKKAETESKKTTLVKPTIKDHGAAQEAQAKKPSESLTEDSTKAS